jgi:RNA polymerase sigma-70 factor (family 1)
MDVVHIETGNDLVALIKKGHTSTFTQFYTSYFQKLLLASNKYIKDTQASEELVQDVFLKIWEKPDHLYEIKSVKSYLYRTVINSSINYINRQKNIEQHHLKIASTFTDDDLTELDEENEMIVLVRTEIEKLPAQCKKVFMLSRFDGFKYKEIANQLDISEKTVENHIGHALKTLRQRFLVDEKMNKKGKNFLMLLNLFLG